MRVRRLSAALVGVLLLTGAASAAPVPTPIGVGAGFLVGPTSPAVARAEPVAGDRCLRSPGARVLAHVELFARGRVLLLPAGIGMAPPLARDGAYVRRGRCSYSLRTTAPTGVVEVAVGRPRTIGHLFRLWGQPLARARLAGFRDATGRGVRAWVAGRRWRGDVRRIPLAPHAQIVVEIGPYVPPHRSFRFPR